MEQIRVGSRVQMMFSDGGECGGVVHRMPSVPGDSWSIENSEGREVLVMQCDAVYLRPHGNDGLEQEKVPATEEPTRPMEKGELIKEGDLCYYSADKQWHITQSAGCRVGGGVLDIPYRRRIGNAEAPADSSEADALRAKILQKVNAQYTNGGYVLDLIADLRHICKGEPER